MYAKISYFSYKFTPPIIDDKFRHWLSQNSKSEIKKFLRGKEKTEWLDFFNPVTLVLILILVILCTIFPLVESKYPNPNSILGNLLAGAAIGLFLSIFGIVVTALSIAKMQVERIFWYKKCKYNFDRNESKAKSPETNFPGTDHEVWNGVDPVMQDAFRDYAEGKPLDQIAKDRNMTEKAVVNIVSRMKARFSKMAIHDTTPPVQGPGATSRTAKPQGVKKRIHHSVYQCFSITVKLATAAGKFLTQRRKLQKALAIIMIAAVVLFGLVVVGKMSSEPKISGHRVGYWVEKLEDRDPITRRNALMKLRNFISADELRPYQDKLAKMAKAGNADAARLLEYLSMY